MITNVSKNTVLAEEGKVARGFWARTKGLIGRKYMGRGEALIFYRCTSVHTFFMKFPIDVVFLDKQMRLIKAYKSFFPCKISRMVLNSYVAIEFCAGTLDRTHTEVGDILNIESKGNGNLSNDSFKKTV